MCGNELDTLLTAPYVVVDDQLGQPPEPTLVADRS